MISRKDVILRHKNLLEEIKRHSKNYYTYDSPKITDAIFDQLKIEALNLEKKYSFLKINKSVSSIIEQSHLTNSKNKTLLKMLSLANAFNLKDMDNFLKK